MNDKENSSYAPTALKRMGGAKEQGWRVEDVVWAVVAEGIVVGDVGVTVAGLTAGLVAVVVTETAGELTEGATEVAPKLAGIWVEWVEG